MRMPARNLFTEAQLTCIAAWAIHVDTVHVSDDIEQKQERYKPESQREDGISLDVVVEFCSMDLVIAECES